MPTPAPKYRPHYYVNSCPKLVKRFLKEYEVQLSNIAVGGVASNSQNDWGSINFICLPNITNIKLSMEERAAHEAGHNMSYWYVHCESSNKNCDGRNFEYDNIGLGSNTEPSVSTSNLINIINDSVNRKNIK